MKDFTTSRHSGRPNKGEIKLSAPPKPDHTIYFGPVALKTELKGAKTESKSKGRMDNPCPTL